MTTFWFKPKRYGYGATPVTWQGWAVTIGSALVMVAAAFGASATAVKSLWAIFAVMLVIEAIAIATLFIVSYRKTEGGWRWRWGDD
jgi:membrane protein YdbS with pleckstrin-like domain